VAQVRRQGSGTQVRMIEGWLETRGSERAKMKSFRYAKVSESFLDQI